MKRTFFFLALLSLALMAHAQRIDKPLCWFDNSSGRFLDISDRYIQPAMQPYAIYIVDRSWRTPTSSQHVDTEVELSPRYEGGAIVYVLPGRRMDDLRRMEHMFMDPVYRYLVRWAAETEESRKKGGGELFLLPVGSPDMIFIRGREETVPFMGVPDAVHIDYTLDYGQSPMFLSLFGAQAAQARFHMYRYYDPAADKSVLAILYQFGMDRDYQISNEMQAFASIFSVFSQMLINNPANKPALDWINNSTWKDIQPDFERCFHLRPAPGTPEAEEEKNRYPGDDVINRPPIDITFLNDSTIVIGERGGRGRRDTLGSLYPVIPLPILDPRTDPKPIDPIDPNDPTKPGQRIVFPDALSLTEGSTYFAENDTATYLIAVRQSMIYSLNKQTGRVSVDSTYIHCYPRTSICGAGCTSDGRLLLYQSTVGVVDMSTRTVLLPDEKRYDRTCMVVNPHTRRVYIYLRGEMREYDEQLRLLQTYTCPLTDNEFCRLHVAKDGLLWVELGRGYAAQAYTTLRNGKFSQVLEPEYQARVPLACPYLGGTFLGLRTDGLYEVPANALPRQLMPAEWRTLQGAVMDSKGQLFVIHDNRILERFTTRGGVRSAQVYEVDLRFSGKGKMLMNGLYIDALDNLWIHNGRDVYLWHPSGKLQGYGDFNGTISFGFE